MQPVNDILQFKVGAHLRAYDLTTPEAATAAPVFAAFVGTECGSDKSESFSELMNRVAAEQGLQRK